MEEKKNGIERDVRKRIGKREIYIYILWVYLDFFWRRKRKEEKKAEKKRENKYF